MQEILRQGESWAEVVRRFDEIREAARRFFAGSGFAGVVFTGCGSSYYLSLSAASLFQAVAGLPSRAVPASEVVFYPEAVFCGGKEHLLVAISRSGETTETVLAMQRARELGVKTMAVSCYETSALVRQSAFALVAEQGKERSVVMTKSFSSMLLALGLFAAAVGGDEPLAGELARCVHLGRDLLPRYAGVLEALARQKEFGKFVYLGAGPFYGIACEAMLKAKEMAYVWSEAYHTLEFRHGPISVVDDRTLVVGLTSRRTEEHDSRLFAEIRSLGGKVLVLGGRPAQGDYLVELPGDLAEFARALLMLPPCQLFAYHKAAALGINPDNPKHLTYVVRIQP